MNDFCRSFLNENWRSMPDAPRIFLSGFGKHPGWNDHLDDIGLITDSLIRAKALIYDGIAHQVESAAWEKGGGPSRIAPGFDHIVHWRRMHESLTGLMWSSSDGKGRSLYPMITLAHCVGQSFAWQAVELLPVLDAVGARCRETKLGVSVVTILNAAQDALRARLGDGKAAATPPDGPGLGVKEWVDHFAAQPLLLRRVLHHLGVNFAPFAAGSVEWCENRKTGPALSRSLRLPVLPGATPAGSLNAWLSFLATQLNPAVPLLGLLRTDLGWIDVIVGEPDPSDFFVLRTLPVATAKVTDIPYELEPTPAGPVATILADVAQGRMPTVSCLNGMALEANRQAALHWLAKFRLSFFGRFFASTGSPF